MSEDAASATVLSTESTATLRQIYDRSRLEQYATKRLLAGGLLMSDNGAAWKRARDLRTSRWSCSARTAPHCSCVMCAVTPAFHRQRLRSLTPLIARRTCCLVDKLQRQQTTHHQGPGRLAFFDMELEFQKLTFDVIGIIALGVDFRSQELEESVYERAWHHILEHLMLSFCVPLPVWAWKCLTFIPSVKRFEEAMSLMDSMVYGTIKQRSSEPIDENDQSILAHMLRVRNSDQDAMQWLTNEQIRNELITLLFAGHDTTTSLVTWALVCWSRQLAVSGALPLARSLMRCRHCSTTLVRMRLFWPTFAKKSTSYFQSRSSTQTQALQHRSSMS